MSTLPAKAVALVLLGAMYGLGWLALGALDAAGHLAPLLLVLLPLMCGRYPWETALVRRRTETRTRRASVSSACLSGAALASPVTLPRGGRLLATALAGRAPPPRFSI